MCFLSDTYRCRTQSSRGKARPPPAPVRRCRPLWGRCSERQKRLKKKKKKADIISRIETNKRQQKKREKAKKILLPFFDVDAVFLPQNPLISRQRFLSFCLLSFVFCLLSFCLFAYLSFVFCWRNAFHR